MTDNEQREEVANFLRTRRARLSVANRGRIATHSTAQDGGIETRGSGTACQCRGYLVYLALIWLGTGKKQARHLIRLVRLGDGIGVRMYLTNVCDPQILSLGEIAQLYARRWDIEMAFRLLKDYLGMSHWWSSK